MTRKWGPVNCNKFQISGISEGEERVELHKIVQNCPLLFMSFRLIAPLVDHLLRFSGLNFLLVRVYMIGSVTELIGIVNHINPLMTSDLTLKPVKMRNDTVTIGIQLQILNIVSRITRTGTLCEGAFLVPINTFPCNVTCFALT